MLGLIAGGAQLLSGIGSALFGGGQRRKAKKALANMPYPVYDIPKEVMENKSLATQMASEGMPSQQYAQGQQNILRQQNSAIRQAQDRRSGIGLIDKIQRATNDATLGLDVESAKMKQQNQRQLLGVNSEVAGYRDKAFDWNKKQKYLMDRQYYQSLLGAGNQNIMSGLDRGLAGAATIGSTLLGGGKNGGGGGSGGSGNPQYYNGYSGSSQYGDFETNY
jgi:hypothetical protein